MTKPKLKEVVTSNGKYDYWSNSDSYNGFSLDRGYSFGSKNPDDDIKSDANSKDVQIPMDLDNYAITFSCFAFEKYKYLMKKNPNCEVAMLGVVSEHDHRNIIDLVVPPQKVTSTTAEIDNDKKGKFDFEFGKQYPDSSPGIKGVHVWLHTHPGNSATPSSTDWETWYGDNFARMNFCAMIIMAQNSHDITCKVRYKTTNDNFIEFDSKVKVGDPYYNRDEEWNKEYDDAVIEEKVVSKPYKSKYLSSKITSTSSGSKTQSKPKKEYKSQGFGVMAYVCALVEEFQGQVSSIEGLNEKELEEFCDKKNVSKKHMEMVARQYKQSRSWRMQKLTCEDFKSRFQYIWQSHAEIKACDFSVVMMPHHRIIAICKHYCLTPDDIQLVIETELEANYEQNIKELKLDK